ncbi:hypothetical protein [Flavobacterium sp.]|uniref:hypothetical protein n=1 Tax=Flavobacterium sp. TaxID=239 RepID=UPI00404712CC
MAKAKTNKKEKKKPVSAVSWCFTDFNEKNIKNGYEKMFEDYKDLIRGVAWGVETCPKSGKLHNQSYIQFYKQQRLGALQRFVGNKCHAETMAGSILHNENYCSKENKFTKLGKFVSRGYRSDLHNLKDDLMNGATEYEIMDNYTGDFLRYHSGISKMKSLIDKKNRNKIGFRAPEVVIIYGDAGTGKTRKIYDEHGFDNVFKVSRYNDDKFMFNGYDNEDVLILDDFYGGIQFSYLLQLLDGYPIDLNVKNGVKYNYFSKVYITSNKPPSEWYKNGLTNTYEWNRRITKCIKVSKGNTGNLTHAPKKHCPIGDDATRADADATPRDYIIDEIINNHLDDKKILVI